LVLSFLEKKTIFYVSWTLRERRRKHKTTKTEKLEHRMNQYVEEREREELKCSIIRNSFVFD